MSKSVVRIGQTYVAKSDTGAFRKDAGSALVKTGAGGLALGGVAWLLPFVSLPMILVFAVFLGMFLYVKD